MILLVTGTRYGRVDALMRFEQYVEVYGVPEFVVVGGDENRGVRSQRGVDLQTTEFFGRRTECLIEWADWDVGPSAGPERNKRLVARCPHDAHCIALPHSNPVWQKGTRHCYNLAVAKGLHAWWVDASL